MKNGGNQIMWVCINLWVRTIFLSIQSFSHQVWLPRKWDGHYFIIFQQLNTWIMNQVNFLREVELVSLVMLLLQLVSQHKYGDTIFWLIDHKNPILNSVGKNSLKETTTNFWPIWVISVTGPWSMLTQIMRKKFLKLLNKT